MDDLERTLREGLRDAAMRKPPLGPVDLAEVTRRSGQAPRRRLPRWLAAAAAVALLAGIGLGASALNGRGVPAIPAVTAASPAANPTDVPSGTSCKLTDVGSVLYPFRVSVRVFSDGRTGGLAERTQLYLRANGFHVITYSEASRSVTGTAATIRGSATDSPEVKLVEKFFPGAVVEGDGRADHSVDVLVVDEPAQVNEPDASVPVSGALCLPAIPGEALDVRVRNASGATFDSVVLEFMDGTREDYGKLGTGKASDYVGVNQAFGYASVTVVTAGRTLKFHPDDYFGEERFGPGHYTYELGVDRDGLTIGLSVER